MTPEQWKQITEHYAYPTIMWMVLAVTVLVYIAGVAGLPVSTEVMLTLVGASVLVLLPTFAVAQEERRQARIDTLARRLVEFEEAKERARRGRR